MLLIRGHHCCLVVLLGYMYRQSLNSKSCPDGQPGGNTLTKDAITRTTNYSGSVTFTKGIMIGGIICFSDQ